MTSPVNHSGQPVDMARFRPIGSLSSFLDNPPAYLVFFL